MARLVGLLLVVACGVARGEDWKGVERADLAKWNAGPGKELCKKQVEAQLKELEVMLTAAKRAKIHPAIGEPTSGVLKNRLSMLFPSAKSKNETIDKFKSAIAAAKEVLKDPPPEYPVLLVRYLEVGRIGRLAILPPDGPQIAEGPLVPFEVSQIVDANNVLGEIGDVTVWLTTDTSGFVDDKVYSLSNQLVEVIGTKQYATVGGTSRTVFHMVLRTHKDLEK